MTRSLGLRWSSKAGLSTAFSASTALEDIRDIRGPESAQPDWLLPALLAGVLLLAVALYAVQRWRRRVRVGPELSLQERALQRLDAIRFQTPPLAAPAFAVAASDIVRRYIEERFGISATRRTTDEFLADILTSRASDLIRHRIPLQEFLQRCDYAKFAGAAVELDGVEGIYRGARTFVSETAPTGAA